MNLSPDLIQVFKNAGHLLGLVSVGLKAGRVELEIVPDETRVYFTFRHRTDGGLILRDKYCMMFSALDRPTFGYHGDKMLARWNSTGSPNLDA